MQYHPAGSLSSLSRASRQINESRPQRGHLFTQPARFDSKPASESRAVSAGVGPPVRSVPPPVQDHRPPRRTAGRGPVSGDPIASWRRLGRLWLAFEAVAPALAIATAIRAPTWSEQRCSGQVDGAESDVPRCGALPDLASPISCDLMPRVSRSRTMRPLIQESPKRSGSVRNFWLTSARPSRPAAFSRRFACPDARGWSGLLRRGERRDTRARSRRGQQWDEHGELAVWVLVMGYM